MKYLFILTLFGITCVSVQRPPEVPPPRVPASQPVTVITVIQPTRPLTPAEREWFLWVSLPLQEQKYVPEPARPEWETLYE